MISNRPIKGTDNLEHGKGDMYGYVRVSTDL